MDTARTRTFMVRRHSCCTARLSRSRTTRYDVNNYQWPHLLGRSASTYPVPARSSVVRDNHWNFGRGFTSCPFRPHRALYATLSPFRQCCNRRGGSCSTHLALWPSARIARCGRGRRSSHRFRISAKTKSPHLTSKLCGLLERRQCPVAVLLLRVSETGLPSPTSGAGS
jgi:hypothetical protein